MLIAVQPETESRRKIKVLGKDYAVDGWTNATEAILSKTGSNLINIPSHPLSIVKEQIYKSFPNFAYYEKIDPVVSTFDNFESLCFPKDHPGRSKTDTYYINQDMLLRTHSSAHQMEILKAGSQINGLNNEPRSKHLLGLARNLEASLNNERFLVAADVYRRDEIDASHYPVFHQMEGVATFDRKRLAEEAKESENIRNGIIKRENESKASGGGGNKLEVVTEDDTQISKDNPIQGEHSPEEVQILIKDMKESMNIMVASVLGMGSTITAENSRNSKNASSSGPQKLPVRWIEAYFPFTSPSWEMEVWFQGKWLEICGCGIVQQSIMERSGRPDRVGWAFGFGLERLAMILFGIPDIRLFWSKDPRFLDQFQPGKISTFKSFSRHPACTKDVSFWLPSDAQFHENDFMDTVREIAGDLAEDVKLIDKFKHPKTGKTSHCYRINYCSMDRNVTNEEINKIQNELRQVVTDKFGVELR
ncbi:phenylalanyl-tRNA synthetase alpha subunit, mitochondrial [Mycoemilia scoparia]|uniref:Phenylalanine--tRNA ligase, mitochondrial n=1 Tax=Mycoemilia scoparia TaxID=417184 RepID=A0A9W8DXD7_9FUNG|nr:phenylalanyl-tRNA synthetase alpha subunit, mitochondrial [Mycoemilia scoparia]